MEQRGHQDAAGANGWMTVPAFGDWDMKNGALPDYSMDFSKIREMRKQNKKELSRASLGGDEDLPQAQQQQRNQAQTKAQPKLGRPADDHRRPLHAGDHSPNGREEVSELLPVLYQGLKRKCCHCLCEQLGLDFVKYPKICNIFVLMVTLSA